MAKIGAFCSTQPNACHGDNRHEEPRPLDFRRTLDRYSALECVSRPVMQDRYLATHSVSGRNSCSFAQRVFSTTSPDDWILLTQKKWRHSLQAMPKFFARSRLRAHSITVSGRNFQARSPLNAQLRSRTMCRLAGVARPTCCSIVIVIGAPCEPCWPLAIGGEKSYARKMRIFAGSAFTTVEGMIISGGGHCLMEVQPQATISAIRRFLDRPGWKSSRLPQ
jgi:pimeloyl-ACP methyl ester carboxylesterase